ncbi:MAG: hypothetical protein PHX62_08975, partial [Bacilli bacterium]|nr:hypothetical protein [Bacilli bacterium]
KVRIYHMRKWFIILLICAVSLSGCSSAKNRIEKETPLKKQVSLIKGEKGIGKFLLDEDGKLHFPSGVVREVSYLLPGYKKVVVDKKAFCENIEKIFSFLSKVEIKTSETPYSPMDGAGLMVDYIHNNQATQIRLLTSYDRKTVYVRFNTEDLNYGSELILSDELSQIIHQLSGWKPFDIDNLKEIDSISIQGISGLASNDLVVTFSGEEARYLLGKMRSSAEVIDWNNGGYNILIKMYKGEVLTYNAYLSGDSSPTIGIETQFFKIDSDVVRDIYKALGYDMTLS